MRYPGFIGGYNQSLSVVADAEDTMNWYLEDLPPRGKNQAALYPTEGYENFITGLTDIGCRGGIVADDRAFVVYGGGLYEVFAGATATRRGSLSQDSYPATLSYNGIAGDQLFITSGGNGYCYDLSTNVLTQVLTGDATQGGMLDGYFIAFDINTSRIRISDLNDGLTWDPTQFLARSSSPDPWMSMLVVQQPSGIWMIGQFTGDVLYDAGTFPFPLAPIPGATFGYGTPAPFSVSSIGDRVAWLSQTDKGSCSIVVARGYTPQRISTHPIESRIAALLQAGTTIADCEAIPYEFSGHAFTVFSFAQGKLSVCYDATSETWHRRGRYVSANNEYDCWFPRGVLYAFGKYLVGGRESSVVARMDASLGTELDGSAIRRERTTPGLFSEHRRVRVKNIEFYLETGLGTQTGQGADPTLVYQNSDDAGKTWHNQRTASAGAVGQYPKRVNFWRCGAARDRVDRIVCTDPIPWRIVDCYVNNQRKAA